MYLLYLLLRPTQRSIISETRHLPQFCLVQAVPHLTSSHGNLLLSDAIPPLQYYAVMYTTLGAGEGAHTKTFPNLNRTI